MNRRSILLAVELSLGSPLAASAAPSALPFSEAHDPLLDRLVNHNLFPRSALLEAAVRFVINDLREHP